MSLRRSWFIPVFGCLAFAVGCTPTTAGKEARLQARERMNNVGAGFTYEQARQAFESGQLPRALREIDRAIVQTPDNAGFHLLRGRILLEMNDLESARQALDASLDKNPELADAHYFAGIVEQRWSHDEAALERYDRAREIEPRNLSYLVAAAEMRIGLGRTVEARQIIDEKIGFFEHHPALLHALGQIALLEGDRARAASLYEQARLRDPDNLQLAEELAGAQYEAGQYATCVATLQSLHGRLPARRSDLVLLEARCLAQMGERETARERFAEAVKLAPDDAGAWIEFGMLAWESGDSDRVAQCASRALSLDAKRWGGWVLQGIDARHRGDLREACAAFSRAAQLGEGQPMVWMLLGHSLEESGNRDQARIAYQKALAIDPDNEEARMLLAAVNQS